MTYKKVDKVFQEKYDISDELFEQGREVFRNSYAYHGLTIRMILREGFETVVAKIRGAFRK